ncbi:MAG TPA: mechanosensitive ion channel domain-containing protein [Bacteroidales bacterium]|nr:mechanosensitive ion channel domain-containing protein [Bacteroidales bacterium]
MLENFDLSLFLKDLFMDLGLGENLSIFLRTILIGLLVVLLSWLAYVIARFIIDRVIAVVVRKTRFTWDDIFLESHLFTRLSHFAPAIVIWAMADWVLADYQGWLNLVQKMTYLYMIIAGILFLYAFIDAWHKIYLTLPIAEHRHIKGYVQLVKIFVSLVAIILSIALLFNKGVGTLVAGLGAMAAVLILVFKDTILGLVASIQLSANKMVKVGDWIVLPSRGADGTVLDISLNTVKIQNWDKTITTVPTHALVQESFHNWKGMEESGGRRIKRAINLDMKSVKFIDRELREKLGKIMILKEYIERKESELRKYNEENGIDDSVVVNGRRMTNLGTFRAYVEVYLRNHPKIHNDMTFLVRQLHPSDKGLPLEIYVFSKDQAWANYEAIQADIFDHLLAVIPEFDLRVFQDPTGDDFKSLIKP